MSFEGPPTLESAELATPTSTAEARADQGPASFEAHEPIQTPLPKSLEYLQERPEPTLEAPAGVATAEETQSPLAQEGQVAEVVPETQESAPEKPVEKPEPQIEWPEHLSSVQISKPFQELNEAELQEVADHLQRKIQNVTRAIGEFEAKGDASATLNSWQLPYITGDYDNTMRRLRHLQGVEEPIAESPSVEPAEAPPEESQPAAPIEEVSQKKEEAAEQVINRIDQWLEPGERGRIQEKLGNPESLRFMRSLDNFQAKYELSEDFYDAALAERLGERAAEFLSQLREEAEMVGLSRELAMQALMRTAAIAYRESLQETEQEETISEVSGEALPLNETVEPAVAEQIIRQAPRESIRPAEARERSAEMREFLMAYKGRVESTIDLTTQLAQLSTEAVRLQDKLEQDPPEALEREYSVQEEEFAAHLHYDGELESREAIEGALADNRFKAEIVKNLLEAQNQGDVEDRLELFKDLVGETVGDPDMVVLRRGEGDQALKEYIPGKSTLLVSYENGQVILEVRSIEGEEGAGVFDSSFAFHEA